MNIVDPITLAVVRGALETAQREMTLTLEKTSRSSVFNLAFTTPLESSAYAVVATARGTSGYLIISNLQASTGFEIRVGISAAGFSPAPERFSVMVVGP